MTDTNKAKLKKVLGILGNTLIWVFVAFSVAVTALVFAAQNSDDGVPELFGTSLITIVTPSMHPVYEAGDLVFLDKLNTEEKAQLRKGDIITYRAPIDIDNDGKIGDLNTHRILSIDPATGAITTKGDNNLAADAYTITANDVIGLCSEDGKISGIGNMIQFLRSSLGFFLCIVLPLILFFIYELYNFISLLVTERAKRAGVDKDTEEEIKRKAIEEYLKNQAQQSPEETTPSEE